MSVTQLLLRHYWKIVLLWNEELFLLETPDVWPRPVNMFIKEKTVPHPKVAPFFKTAPLRSRFISSFFLSV